MKWEDCDTLGKKVGFVVGKVFNTIVTTTQKCIRKVIVILYLDKISGYFLDFFKLLYEKASKCLDRVIEIASNFIHAVAQNTVVKAIRAWTYDHIISPINNLIHKAVKFIFVTVLWETICRPIADRIFKPLWNKIQFKSEGRSSSSPSSSESQDSSVSRFFKTLADWTVTPVYNHILTPIGHKIKDLFDLSIRGLKTVGNWTVVPFCKRVLSPIGSSIGDFIYGSFSGVFGTDDKKNPEAPKPEEQPKASQAGPEASAMN